MEEHLYFSPYFRSFTSLVQVFFSDAAFLLLSRNIVNFLNADFELSCGVNRGAAIRMSNIVLRNYIMPRSIICPEELAAKFRKLARLSISGFRFSLTSIPLFVILPIKATTA